MRGLWGRFRALSTPVKIVIALALAGMGAVLSPLMVFLAALAFAVCLLVLLLCVLTRRAASRNWGLAALTALAAILAFSGVSEALYGGSHPETTPVPEVAEKEPAEPHEEPKPETTAAPEPKREEPTREEVAEAPEPVPVPEPEPILEPAPPPVPAPAEPSYDATATVTRVVDGDTVEISPAIDGVEDVRLIGVDTPETKEPGCAPQPYGSEASSYAESVLPGQRIELEFGVERTDRYDRLLAYVYTEDGEMFNENLLEGGYAQAYPYPPDTKYADRFARAQESASAAGLGIWALGPDHLALLTDRGNGIGGEGCAPFAAYPVPQYQAPTTPAPIPAVPATPAGPPAGGDLDCKDFGSLAEVQESIAAGDPHGLDADGDGSGCESQF
ncbi:MAG: thermonuclease family protein [Actinomycetota bacterium]|nr:thermonuclease family protein [Actinomycetota bacterium]